MVMKVHLHAQTHTLQFKLNTYGALCYTFVVAGFLKINRKIKVLKMEKNN